MNMRDFFVSLFSLALDFFPFLLFLLIFRNIHGDHGDMISLSLFLQSHSSYDHKSFCLLLS